MSIATINGTDPASIGSFGKLTNAAVVQRFANLAWRFVGADSTAWAGPGLGELHDNAPDAQWADALFTLSLSSAGANEIQCSIMAERLLAPPANPWSIQLLHRPCP
jgi:hypothetical protein